MLDSIVLAIVLAIVVFIVCDQIALRKPSRRKDTTLRATEYSDPPPPGQFSSLTPDFFPTLKDLQA
jgi:hypothetical protein